MESRNSRSNFNTIKIEVQAPDPVEISLESSSLVTSFDSKEERQPEPKSKPCGSKSKKSAGQPALSLAAFSNYLDHLTKTQ